MAEKMGYDESLIRVGGLLEQKRKALGKQYASREKFIMQRSLELFAGEQWISLRHLTNIELGKNWMSLEMLIKHSYALETDPVELFSDIVHAYNG